MWPTSRPWASRISARRPSFGTATTGEPLHNALVWQDTRVGDLVAAFALDGGQDRFRAKHRPAARDVLQRAKAQVAARQRARCPRESGERRRAVRHDRLLDPLESHGRPCGRLAPHRRHEREPHAARRSRHARLGRRVARGVRHPARGAAAHCRVERGYGDAQIAALRGVPIAGILGDQQAALVGQTCFAPGEAKNTYGTGCFMLMNTGAQIVPSTAGLITTVAYQFGDEPPHYALEGLDRDRRRAGPVAARQPGVDREERRHRERSRAKSRTTATCISCRRSRACSRRTGARRRAARSSGLRATRIAATSRAQRSRPTAYQTREVLEAMEHDSHIPIKELRVDGGMVGNELLMQFQADMLGVPVVRPCDHRDHGARRGLCGRSCGGLLVGTRRARAKLGGGPALESENGRRREHAALPIVAKSGSRSFDWIERAALQS